MPKYVIVKRGAWHVRLTFSQKGADGKSTTKQYSRRCIPETATRAADIAEQIKREYNGLAPAPSSSVESMALSVLAAKRGAVSARTLDDYQWLFDFYVKNTQFARSDSVTPFDVQQFYGSLNASPVMLRKLNTFLSMVFNQAIRWQLCSSNPCKGVILPMAAKKDVEVFDEVEARRFITTCVNNPVYHILAFALDTGLRPSEYTCLTRKDVSNGYVRVNRSVKFTGDGFVFGPPKTRTSRRTVQLSPQMASLVKEQSARIDEWRASLERLIKTPYSQTGVRRNREKVKRKTARPV